MRSTKVKFKQEIRGERVLELKTDKNKMVRLHLSIPSNCKSVVHVENLTRRYKLAPVYTRGAEDVLRDIQDTPYYPHRHHPSLIAPDFVKYISAIKVNTKSCPSLCDFEARVRVRYHDNIVVVRSLMCTFISFLVVVHLLHSDFG